MLFFRNRKIWFYLLEFCVLVSWKPILFPLLLFGRGAAKNTTQGGIFGHLPITKLHQFMEFRPNDIFFCGWRVMAVRFSQRFIIPRVLVGTIIVAFIITFVLRCWFPMFTVFAWRRLFFIIVVNIFVVELSCLKFFGNIERSIYASVFIIIIIPFRCWSIDMVIRIWSNLWSLLRRC